MAARPLSCNLLCPTVRDDGDLMEERRLTENVGGAAGKRQGSRQAEDEMNRAAE
ncbi:uncharacterized protein ACO6RY_00054 [Pungitius sinensis]